MKEWRIAGVATIPGREEALADVLRSIVPQVDLVYIACNNYGEQTSHPAMSMYGSRAGFSFPDSPEVEHWSKGRQDNNKFLYLDHAGCSGYRFTLDDDIIYPPTYIEDSIDFIEWYDRKRVISWGGKRYDDRPILSYYKSMSLVLNCLFSQADDIEVHIPLSGASAWHTSTIVFNPENWKHPLMCDIYEGIECLEQGVPIIAASRDDGYLKHSTKIDFTTTIFRRFKDDCETQTGLVSAHQWPALSD